MDAAGNPVAGVVFGAKGLLAYGTSGYQFDPQGNATHLMDDDGLVVAHLAYDAWGQRMSGNNPTPYGYKGQWGYYTDAETGLLLLTHRYLDPATGRFLTRDPVGFDGGINLYAYVGNGVVNKVDPNGLVPLYPPFPGIIAPCEPAPPPMQPPSGAPPSACSEYERLCSQGDRVACLMIQPCRSAGNSPWSNCVRGCLLERFKACRGDWACEIFVYLTWGHLDCWTRCLDYAPTPCILGRPRPIICMLPLTTR